MSQKLYTGLNIQWPISELILTGKKTIETRTYPLPEQYLNQELLMIETPGKSKKFKSRGVAIIIFESSFLYTNKTAFYKDAKKHFVTEQSEWAWKDKPKWGWIIKEIKKFPKPIPIEKRLGIIYTKNINCNF